MPVTKNFSTRIEMLDELLSSIQRRNRAQLLRALNQSLRLHGFDAISERTLTNDLAYLRDKGAPLAIVQKGQPHYYYTSPFSLKSAPLSADEIKKLRQATDLLRKVTPLTMVKELEHLMDRLESQIQTSSAGSRRDIIQFEDHTIASGNEWLDDLFKAILEQKALRVGYKPFGKSRTAFCVFHPYLLKEYRKRWFVFGRVNQTNFTTNFALDRIKQIESTITSFMPNNLFDPAHYCDDIVGVSVPRHAPIEDIVILVRQYTVPYVLSKPLHRLQKTTRVFDNGDIEISIPLKINYELKSLILSYGSGMEVLAPFSLRDSIQSDIGKLHFVYSLE